MRYYPTAIEIIMNPDIDKDVLVKEIVKHNPKVVVKACEKMFGEDEDSQGEENHEK